MRSYIRSVALVAILFGSGAPFAEAHPADEATILLDFEQGIVRAEVQLPFELMAKASGVETGESVLERDHDVLAKYLLERVRVTSPDAKSFAVHLLAPLRMVVVDGIRYVTAELLLVPPEGSGDELFSLQYDAILDRFPNHIALVAIRSDWHTSTFQNQPKLVGVAGRDKRLVKIDRSDAGWFRGFASIFRSGMAHIAEGTDHLLFLLALLLPAPVVVRDRRWAGVGPIRRTLIQILTVVTAFTVGHSVTLAGGALGLVELPSRPVEIVIAISILVSALHAIRPLFPGREAVVAIVFGLIHGMAFATTLAELGLGRWERVASIFAFNLGIETMQVIVVAAAMPSLIMLSRTNLYPALRISGALFAVFASFGWIVERIWNVGNPLERPIEMVAHHAIWIAAALTVAGILALSRDRKTAGSAVYGAGGPHTN